MAPATAREILEEHKLSILDDDGRPLYTLERVRKLTQYVDERSRRCRRADVDAAFETLIFWGTGDYGEVGERPPDAERRFVTMSLHFRSDALVTMTSLPTASPDTVHLHLRAEAINWKRLGGGPRRALDRLEKALHPFLLVP